MKVNPPNIMEGRTPEQNISAIRGWATQLAYELTMKITDLESEIEELKKGKEEGNGV